MALPILIGVHRQGVHRWLVHGLEHTPPGPLSLLEPLRVELLQEVGDRFVELIEGKEPPVAEPGEDLALDDQDSSLHGCLVSRLSGSSRQDRHLIVPGPLQVALVEDRVIL